MSKQFPSALSLAVVFVVLCCWLAGVMLVANNLHASLLIKGLAVAGLSFLTALIVSDELME